MVLAGGRSRRFGSDKLAEPIGGRSLLEHALSGLPEDWMIIVVGPDRSVQLRGRDVHTVREQPPYGGPAAAVVAGAATAVDLGAGQLVTLPGDVPAAGRAARALVAALTDGAAAVVGIDEQGVEQPLQLAVRGTPLARLAGRADADGLSARRLLGELGDYRRLPLHGDLTADIDTRADLDRLDRS